MAAKTINTGSASQTVQVGQGSHQVIFYHELVGTLVVHTGLDSIQWGYELNTANYPTYGGEVVQILSCYVSDLTVQGTLRNYADMETVYSYFLNYIRGASADGTRNETPMTFEYPHRGWTFKIFVTQAPGYRKARELTTPEWQINAFVVDDANDIQDLKDLITLEAQIKANVGSTDPNFDSNFSLEGKIGFVDENPFSDPFTDAGTQFSASQDDALKKIGNYYSSLLPSYINGDFDSIFGSIGSQPAFNPKIGAKGTTDPSDQARKEVKGSTHGTNSIPGVNETFTLP